MYFKRRFFVAMVSLPCGNPETSRAETPSGQIIVVYRVKNMFMKLYIRMHQIEFGIYCGII